MTQSEENNWAMFCHLATFAGLIGIPFGSILGPMIVWLMKKNESAFVDRHGRAALNFNISMTIYMIVSLLLILVIIGVLLFPACILVWLIFSIIATVKANKGEEYSYPLAIRFLGDPPAAAASPGVPDPGADAGSDEQNSGDSW